MVIDLATRRQARAAPVTPAFLAIVADEFARQARDVADLACPIIEPFHFCEARLEAHLRGAFVDWQIEQVRFALAGKPYADQALPVAIEATVQAFEGRLLDLQGGDPPGGDAA